MTDIARTDTITWVGGTATVTTGRPATTAPWTVAVNAPGLPDPLDGWAHMFESGSVARMMHQAAVDLVRDAIADIPVIEWNQR